MVARSVRSSLVPFTLLEGASCLLPERRAFAPPVPVREPGRIAPPGLTTAEQRVCELLLQGLSNKEIASALDRAEPTIKNQVASILRKFGVPSRMRLMALLRA
jgi:DNA-binding NarL/FixJ family response regulator